MRKTLFTLLTLFFLAPSFQSLMAQPSQRMTLLGQWDNPAYQYTEVWGWAAPDGREYGIIGTKSHTFFIDITDPANPVVADSVAGANANNGWRDFKTYRNFCYGVADGNAASFQAIDMSYLPDSVVKTYDNNTHFTKSHNIYIDTTAGRLYAVGTNTLGNGCFVFDLTANPAQPTLLSAVGLGHYAHDVFVINDTAYFSNGNFGLTVWDYTDAQNPVLIGQLTSYPDKGYNHASWRHEGGKYLAMVDETHNKACKLVDVSDLGNMNVVSLFKSALLAPADTASIVHNPFVIGDYIVCSYYHDGIQIFDMSDPFNVVQYAWYDTYPNNTNYGGYSGNWGAYPYLPSGTIIASDRSYGLHIFRANFPFPYDMSSSATVTPVSCFGGSDGEVTIEAAGGTFPYTYNWSNGDTSNTATGLSMGTYQVTISDRYGNQHFDTVSVNQPSMLSGSLIPFGESCVGVSDGGIDLVPGGGSPGYSYLWSDGSTGRDLMGVSAGTYYVTVTDTNGCSLSDSATVALLNSPPDAFAGNDTTVCAPDFNLAGASPTVGTGAWALVNGAGGVRAPADPASQVVGLGAGTNSFAWTVTNGPCVASDTVEVSLTDALLAQAGMDTNLCDDSYMLNANAPQGAASGVWSFVQGQAMISDTSSPTATLSGLTPGTYQLQWTISDPFCSVNDQVDLSVNFPPMAGFTPSANLLNVSFTDNSQYASAYAWDFGDGNTSTVASPTHTYAAAGAYQVCMTVENECGTDTLCEKVQVIEVALEDEVVQGIHIYPNPNSGRFVVELDQAQLQALRVEIFNPLGKVVYSQSLEPGNGLLKLEVDLSQEAAGIYLLEIATGTARIVKKVMKY